MKIANFKIKDRLTDAPRPGLVVDDEILDLGKISESPGDGRARASEAPREMLSLIRRFDELHADFVYLLEQSTTQNAFGNARIKIRDAKLAAPVERPGKLICLAGNYREHITESGFVAPEQTDVITQQLFLKPSTAIIGDEDEIVIGSNNVRVGWETELAIVIGKSGKNIPVSAALEHVFGYTILNDVSERALNSRIENRRQREMDRFLDWLAGKWFDTFAPCGPWIVTADEVADPHDLNIKLTINGELRQQGSTADMIFQIPEQIAYASSIMTLEPGDIISTGTPAGAGLGLANTSLQDGDELICEIETIGTLKNSVRYAP